MSQTVSSRQDSVSYKEAPLCALHKKVIAGGMLGQFSDGYILGSIGISMSLATAALGLDCLVARPYRSCVSGWPDGRELFHRTPSRQDRSQVDLL